MVQLLYTGKAVQLFFASLQWIEESDKETKESAGEGLVLLAPRSLQVLIEFVKQLDVDIGDQLKEELKDICDNYMNSKYDQDLKDGLRVRLKKKLCGSRSEIFNTRRLHLYLSVKMAGCWPLSFCMIMDLDCLSIHHM